MDAVALQHIKKSYTSYSSEIVLTGQTRQSRTRQVLRDLSVCFPIGQLTVIVGRSGCGKSTLLKLLAGKEQPDAGQIEMPQGWHSALLSPDPYVITWTNVQRNVAMACGVGKTPEERYEKAADFVRLVGLQDFADLTPAELSTGMKQRLGIAMALLGSPKLLILDEPANFVDNKFEKELYRTLHELNTRMAIVMVSHDIEHRDRKLPVEIRQLRHIADQPLLAPEQLRRQTYFARMGHGSEYGFHECRLSAAVGTYDTQEIVVADFQIDMLNGFVSVVCDAYVAHRYQIHFAVIKSVIVSMFAMASRSSGSIATYSASMSRAMTSTVDAGNCFW